MDGSKGKHVWMPSFDQLQTVPKQSIYPSIWQHGHLLCICVHVCMYGHAYLSLNTSVFKYLPVSKGVWTRYNLPNYISVWMWLFRTSTHVCVRAKKESTHGNVWLSLPLPDLYFCPTNYTGRQSPLVSIYRLMCMFSCKLLCNLLNLFFISDYD